MGGFQSTEKKSPSKTVKEDTSSKSAGKTPVKSKADGEPQIRVSPPKTPPTATETDLSVTEEDMASVEAAAKKIRDSLKVKVSDSLVNVPNELSQLGTDQPTDSVTNCLNC